MFQYRGGPGLLRGLISDGRSRYGGVSKDSTSIAPRPSRIGAAIASEQLQHLHRERPNALAGRNAAYDHSLYARLGPPVARHRGKRHD
jgi:hypothetical protein